MKHFGVIFLAALTIVFFGNEIVAEKDDGLIRSKRQPGGIFPDARTRTINPPRGRTDSITMVVLRDYRDARGRIVTSRVESIQASITAATINPRGGRNFNNADREHMRRYMQAGPNDEAGHLIAATIGGTRQRYNLAPQHNTLNRNVNERQNPHILNDIWFTEENRIRAFVQQNPRALVVLTVTPQYDTINSRRPTSFLMVSQFSNNGQRLPQMDRRGYTRNEAPRMGL